MKKILVMLAIATAAVSCETKETTSAAAGVKTAYIDTEKMMEDCIECKDITEKYKAKGEEIGKKFEVEEANFKAEAASFEQNARANGQAWAQQKGAELSKKQQYLEYTAQQVSQQLQMQHASEMDSVKKSIREVIKTYGKEKGYDYIFGTGDSPSVLYAKDSYDITKEVTELINEKYKGKKDEKPEAKKEEKKN